MNTKTWQFQFSAEKNAWLKETRGIGFDELIACLEDDRLIETVPHPNQDAYPGQEIFLIDVNGYVYSMPFMRTGNIIFLKTAYPTRKVTKRLSKRKLI